jgi:ribosomal protein S12 methylthiotransferase
LNQDKIGRTEKVLVDRKEGNFYIGRTSADSPEVDNEVIIRNAKGIKPGDFIQVKITGAEEFDLYAEPV